MSRRNEITFIRRDDIYLPSAEGLARIKSAPSASQKILKCRIWQENSNGLNYIHMSCLELFGRIVVKANVKYS